MSGRRTGSRLAQLRSRDRSRDRRRDHQAEKKRAAKVPGPNFVMPYGEWKGRRILEVPIGYLCWMVREEHTIAARAAREIDRRLRIRERARGTT